MLVLTILLAGIHSISDQISILWHSLYLEFRNSLLDLLLCNKTLLKSVVTNDNHLLLLHSFFCDSRVVILLSSIICLESAAGRVRSFSDLSWFLTHLSSVSFVQHNWADLTLAHILCHFLSELLGLSTRSWMGFQDHEWKSCLGMAP